MPTVTKTWAEVQFDSLVCQADGVLISGESGHEILFGEYRRGSPIAKLIVEDRRERGLPCPDEDEFDSEESMGVWSRHIDVAKSRASNDT